MPWLERYYKCKKCGKVDIDELCDCEVKKKCENPLNEYYRIICYFELYRDFTLEEVDKAAAFQ